MPVDGAPLTWLVATAVVVALSVPSRRSLLAGAPLVLAGEALRLWTSGHLVKSARLVTSGPYRHTRNPMYLGRLLIGTGLLIAGWLPHGATFVVLPLFWAGFFGLYMRRKERVEPARLLALHGEAYRDYRRAVPALFPRLTPWSGARASPWRASRVRQNRELLTAFGVLALLLLLAVRAA